MSPHGPIRPTVGRWFLDSSRPLDLAPSLGGPQGLSLPAGAHDRLYSNHRAQPPCPWRPTRRSAKAPGTNSLGMRPARHCCPVPLGPFRTVSTEVKRRGSSSHVRPYGPLLKIRPLGVPRFRPHLPSQTCQSDGLSQGRATSTCCATVTALEVSHLRDGSALEKLAHVAALPDEIRFVSRCLPLT